MGGDHGMVYLCKLLFRGRWFVCKIVSVCAPVCVAITGVVCACDSLCMYGVHVWVGSVVVNRTGYLDVPT